MSYRLVVTKDGRKLRSKTKYRTKSVAIRHAEKLNEQFNGAYRAEVECCK